MKKARNVARRIGVQVNYDRDPGSRTPDLELENNVKDLLSKFGARSIGSGEELIGHKPYVVGIFSSSRARSNFLDALSKVEEFRYLEVTTRELRPGEG